MKIGQPLPADLCGLKPADAAPAEAAPRGITPGPARAAGQVTLSRAANAMSGLHSASADFDAAKVAAIQAAMREGRFTVNAPAIADQLIAEAAAMISPRTH